MPNRNQILDLLERLRTTLSELESAQEKKQLSLRNLDLPSLYSVAETEKRLALLLAKQLRERDELFAQASSDHPPASDRNRASFAPTQKLQNILAELPSDDSLRLAGQWEEVRQRAERVKRQIGMNWATTYFVNRTVADMLQLIRQSQGSASSAGTQGLLVDSTF